MCRKVVTLFLAFPAALRLKNGVYLNGFGSFMKRKNKFLVGYIKLPGDLGYLFLRSSKGKVGGS